MKAISLFSSAGIGDLALHANGISVLIANELLEDRASLHRKNFPLTNMMVGDIWKLKDQLIQSTITSLCGDELSFLLATPPCQGMSKNGQGKLLQGIRDGKKPKFDERNRLIIPTLDIVCALRPRTVVFENVPEMLDTLIEDENGNAIKIVDYIKFRLGSEYAGTAEVVQFADYGVPQRRSRLITIFSRDAHLQAYFSEHGSYLPPQTHSKDGERGLLRWVSVKETIENLPPLDSKNLESATSDIQYHRVPVLDQEKYFWISNTPPEKGAFDNQCVNPECLYQKNATHGSEHDGNGINKSKTTTPIFCVKCGALLPRPSAKDEAGQPRLMRGYTSAYKRMSWSLPSPTLTTNLSYPCSDHKVHPAQNRVLSLYEAFKLHTLDRFDYLWELDNGKPAKDSLIREVIGESIPPFGLQQIFENLVKISNGVPIKRALKQPEQYRLKLPV